jgi:hypothetical protein
MTEIFITDIQSKIQADEILNFFKIKNPGLKISYDLNETEKSYPCGHTIIRVEGDMIHSESILTTVRNSGYHCELLEDKVCI